MLLPCFGLCFDSFRGKKDGLCLGLPLSSNDLCVNRRAPIMCTIAIVNVVARIAIIETFRPGRAHQSFGYAHGFVITGFRGDAFFIGRLCNSIHDSTITKRGDTIYHNAGNVEASKYPSKVT